jgi:hypothetical protein
MGFEAFINGVKVGDAEDHHHGSGSALTLTVVFSSAVEAALAAVTGGGASTLTLISEELGYANYGFKTPLYKGIHGGTPQLDGKDLVGEWTMRSGLAGEHMKVMTEAGSRLVAWKPLPAPPPSTGNAGTWYEATFATPASVSDDAGGGQLFLHALGELAPASGCRATGLVIWRT